MGIIFTVNITTRWIGHIQVTSFSTCWLFCVINPYHSFHCRSLKRCRMVAYTSNIWTWHYLGYVQRWQSGLSTCAINLVPYGSFQCRSCLVNNMWHDEFALKTSALKLALYMYIAIYDICNIYTTIFRLKRINNLTWSARLFIVYVGKQWYKWFVTWSHHAISLLGRWFVHSLPCDVRRHVHIYSRI